MYEDRPDGAPQMPEAILSEMAAEGGRVTFARFMELALTHPREGYYTAAGGRAVPLLGRRGDFSTAPHLSPTFCRAVGRLLVELVDASLAAAPDSTKIERTAGAGRAPVGIVELGGGEGDLAAAVLEEWLRDRRDLRARIVYTIVEIGEALRARQQETVAEMMQRGWKVRWVGDLQAAAGRIRPTVVLGNEFLDALPVHVLDVRGSRPLEAWVAIARDDTRSVTECWDELSPEAGDELRFLFGDSDCDRLRPLTRDGFIELRPAVGSLLDRIAVAMGEGSVLTIDYGGWLPGIAGDGPVACAPYGPPTHGRTVRGYFKHQPAADPYARIGRQDLTADVDFRALDAHGRAVGFETVLYTSVAALLQAGGGQEELESLRARAVDSLEADREAAVVEALLDGHDLGGAFKVMLQVREQ